MNELAMMDKNLSVERTPELIAVEINSIKEQTRKALLFNSIEIGRRLAEAKAMIQHGQWGEWLEKYVNYSQRTASNLIRIFEEYGSSQITIFCDNAKSQALANLSYTQAVALLGIPQDEREAFVEDHDLDNMSTRELQQAIKEKQELEVKLMETEVELGGAKRDAEKKSEEATQLQDEKQALESEVQRLSGLLEEAKDNGASEEQVTQLQTELKEAREQIERLTEELSKPIEVTAADVIEKVPEAVDRELSELRAKVQTMEEKQGNTAVLRFSIYFDILVKGFRDILNTLPEIKEIDLDHYEKHKNAVKKLLERMSERL